MSEEEVFSGAPVPCQMVDDTRMMMPFDARRLHFTRYYLLLSGICSAQRRVSGGRYHHAPAYWLQSFIANFFCF